MTHYGNLQKHLNPNPVQRVLLDRFHRRIGELVAQTGVPRLLDAGCAEGFVIEALRRTNPALAIIGGDFDGGALGWGRTNLGHQVPLAQIDLHHLPFPDHSFPLVMCLEVLEHLPDSVVGLRELARVSSGYILVSVPHEPWFRAANFLRGKHVTALGNDPEHIHNYTGFTFRRMIEPVVEIIWHGYCFPWQIALARKM